jgi:hypothetical protein
MAAAVGQGAPSPALADGIFLRTWRAGASAEKPKTPKQWLAHPQGAPPG